MKRLALLLLLLTSPAYAETKQFHEVNVGNGMWYVRGYIRAEDNSFSHCVASTQFDAASAYHRKYLRSDSVALMIKLHSDDTYTFSILGKDWKLNPGNIYSLEFDFNDGEHFEGKAVAADDIALDINAKPETSGKWFTWMAKSNWVAISIDGRSLGKFALKKSKEAMTALLECFEGAKKGEEITDGTFGGGQGSEPESDFGPGAAQ